APRLKPSSQRSSNIERKLPKPANGSHLTSSIVVSSFDPEIKHRVTGGQRLDNPPGRAYGAADWYRGGNLWRQREKKSTNGIKIRACRCRRRRREAATASFISTAIRKTFHRAPMRPTRRSPAPASPRPSACTGPSAFSAA